MWHALAMLTLSLFVAAMLTQVASFTTTIYLHRALTHKALVLHPKLCEFFHFILWLTTGIDPREWVAVHRKHHAFTDEEGDPHSPKIKGSVWKVLWLNVYYYVREAHNPETLRDYASDITYPGYWKRFPFHQGLMGVGLGTVGLCLILGPAWGLLTGSLHATMYIMGSASINSFCHWFGYRTFDNTATNVRSISLFTGGEGLHNNHHQYPRSPKFSFGPSEVDLAWPVVKLLVFLGWAKRYKTIHEIVGA